MNRQNLYRKIKDRNALELFKSLKFGLDTAKPNGATIHDLAELRESFSVRVKLSKMRGHGDETIEDYRKRNEETYKNTRDRILKAINKYNVGGI